MDWPEEVTDPLTAAQDAHHAALAAQQSMHEASRRRDKAVQQARAAGIPVAQLKVALGVNRQRIHAMLKAAEKETE